MRMYVGVDYLFVPSVCHVLVCRVHSVVCNVCEYNVLYQCGVSVSSVLHIIRVCASVYGIKLTFNLRPRVLDHVKGSYLILLPLPTE